MNTILFVGEHPDTFDVQWHSHDQWELVYCTGGISGRTSASSDSLCRSPGSPPEMVSKLISWVLPQLMATG